MYLLDTNVVSELRRARPHQAVVRWIRSIPEEHLYLSAVTIGEIQAGIEITRDQDAAKADELEAWLALVINTYNVLDIDAVVFREWARLMRHQSNTLSLDALIAAVANIHRLTVVTRNVRHFRQLSVPTLNPFSNSSG